MNATLMLVTASLRKNKSQTFTMLLIIAICVMLLNIGLVMYIRAGEFFDRRADELNAPHWSSFVFETTDESVAERYEFVRTFPGVAQAERLSIISHLGEITIQDSARTGLIIIAPYSETQQMNSPTLIGDGLPLTGNAIYVPYFLTLGSGIALGDEVTISFSGEELHFTLAGATEEIKFGASTYTIWRFYIPQTRFDELSGGFPDAVMSLVSARMENQYELWRLTTAYFDEFLEDEVSLNIASLSTMRSARTSNPIIAATLIAAFALIVLVVGIIVIRFRIINGIEENMVNIGVQKAVGYRNRQIIFSIILQFGLITLVGGVLGILASRAALPLVISLIQPLFGLRWNPGFDIPMAAVSLAVVVPAVVLFSYITALRARKLHPLAALRGGISTHSFRRNYFPLEKSCSPLVPALALKSLFMNKKQALMICLIIAAVSFTAAGGLITHYSININQSEFMLLQFGDVPDVWFEVADFDNIYAFRAEMEAHPEVRRIEMGDNSAATPNSTTSIVVNNVTLNMGVIENFENITDYALISGRFPRHENEITVGSNMLSYIGASIGDLVTVTGISGETSETFMVTGSTQSANQQGMISLNALAYAGINFSFDTLTVHLLPDTDIDTFIENVLMQYSDIFSEAVNMQSIFEQFFAPIGTIFAAVAAAALAVVAAVVILVIFLVIKTSILRRRRELGIQKAMGFTTLELMNQIALSMIPIIIFGAALGALGASFGFNGIFVALLRGAGIAQANLPIPLAWIAVMCALLVALSYTISLLTAWRIRKISAYALVTGY